MTMIAIILNGRTVGTLLSHMALQFARTLCVQQGDVVELAHLDYQGDPFRTESTLYRNGTEVLTINHNSFGGEWCGECCCYHDETDMSQEETDRPVSQRHSPTRSYTRRLSGFKCNIVDPIISRGFRSYLKRDLRRTERRVGRRIISEQID